MLYLGNVWRVNGISHYPHLAGKKSSIEGSLLAHPILYREKKMADSNQQP